MCSAVGTTGTTGVDPVRRFGEIARAEQMWHHVDAAYAGSAMICEEFRHHQDGLELVDSYTFNPHKWLATNLDCSVMWVADRRPLIAALSVLPPYLRDEASESGQVIDYRDWHGPLGRPFRALKLWFVLRCFGAQGLREMIRTHVAWARDLTERIDAHPRLATIAPTPFALVCFAHAQGDEATDDLVDTDQRRWPLLHHRLGSRRAALRPRLSRLDLDDPGPRRRPLGPDRRQRLTDGSAAQPCCERAVVDLALRLSGGTPPGNGGQLVEARPGTRPTAG